MDETELERLVVRITGDASEYQSALNEAVEASSKAAQTLDEMLPGHLRAPEMSTGGASTSELTQTLQRQADTYGMTSRQIDIYDASLQGVSASELQLARSIDEQLTAMEKQGQLYRQGEQLTQAMRNPTEVYRDRVADLKKLLDSGSISHETFNRALAQAQSQLDNTGRAAVSFRGSLSGVSSAASSMRGILAAAGLSFGLLGTAIKGVQMAAASESTRVDMEVLLGSADAAKKMITDLATFSEATPLRMPGLLANAKQLMQMGVEAEQIVPILKALGNASGGSQEKLSQMTYVFGRMASMGHVSMREVHMLTTAGFNPLREISKMTGESVASLTEKLHRGGITAEMVVRAFNNASKSGGTFAGRLERQSQTLGGLFSTMRDHVDKVIKEIGNIIVEGLDLKQVIRNVTDGGRMVLAWLKAITPETRVLIGQVLSVAAAVGVGALAFTLLSPVIGTVVGTITTLISVVTATIGVIIALATSPIGLLIGALAALAIATGHGINLIGTFGEAWKALSDYLRPTVQGIKDAIQARDLSLAFEIGWAQIKKSFYEFSRDLTQGWYDTNFTLRTAWENTVDWMARRMSDTSFNIQKSWLDFRNLVSDLEPDVYNEELTRLMVQHGNELVGLDKEHKKVQEENLATAQNHVNQTSQAITKLQDELDKLNREARNKAVNVAPLKMPTIPEIDPNKFKVPPQQMHVTPVMHWEPALAGSAEAVARIQTQADMLAGEGLGLGAHATGHGRAGGPEGMAPGGGLLAQPAEALAGGNISPVPVQVTGGGAFGDDSTRQQIVTLLSRAVDDLDILAKKPQVNLQPANLAP
jgi:tape measure domain-containing protein